LKKLRLYYIYLLCVIIFTAVISTALIIFLFYKDVKLIHFFVSTVFADSFLWMFAALKKPSREDIMTALIKDSKKRYFSEEEIHKYFEEECKKQVNEVKIKVEELHDTHEKYLSDDYYD